MTNRIIHTTLASLTLAAALALTAGPATAGMPDMDDPLTMKVKGGTGGGNKSAGGKISKKQRRLMNRRGQTVRLAPPKLTRRR